MTLNYKTVLKQFKSENDVICEEINDLLKSVETNNNTNNLKANDLIIASRYFAFSVFFTVFLSIFVMFNIFGKYLMDTLLLICKLI